MKIITKKINNTLIFYDKDIEINIEELFRSGFFSSEDIKNVEWINEDKWVKKHYIRKGMMSFLKDKYLYVDIKNTDLLESLRYLTIFIKIILIPADRYLDGQHTMALFTGLIW